MKTLPLLYSKFTIFFAFLLLLIPHLQGFAQGDLSAFTATGRGVATTFTTDYQTIGINPANLGFRRSFRDPLLTIGFFEQSSSFFSGALNRGELIQTVLSPSDINLSLEEKARAVPRLQNRALSASIDFMIVGIGLSLPKAGGFAFSIRDKIQLFTRLNPTVTEIAFLGNNASYFPEVLLSNGRIIRNSTNLPENVREQVIGGGYYNNPQLAKNYGEILDGSRLSAAWYREYNFSYGVKIIDQYNLAVHIGAGAKLLRGIALIDLLAENNQLIQDNISLSPTFGLTFGEDPSNPTAPGFISPEQNASRFKKYLGAKPVGTGFGFDMGVNIVIKKNFYLGAALTNIGSINWTGNAYNLSNGRLEQIEGTGLNTYNIFAASEENIRFGGDKSLFQLNGVNEIRTQLPSTLRIGGSYEYFRTFHIGFDVIVPLNDVSGNFNEAWYGIGGDWRINRWFKFSMGFNTGGNQGGKVNIPMGITYNSSRRWYEIGFATRDISSYLASNFAGGTTISFASGFLRFKINEIRLGKARNR
jgi:hypothetical protein